MCLDYRSAVELKIYEINAGEFFERSIQFSFPLKNSTSRLISNQQIRPGARKLCEVATGSQKLTNLTLNCLGFKRLYVVNLKR